MQSSGGVSNVFSEFVKKSISEEFPNAVVGGHLSSFPRAMICRRQIHEETKNGGKPVDQKLKKGELLRKLLSEVL